MVEVNIDLWQQKRSQPLESICRTNPPTPSLVVTANLWLSNLFSELKFTAEREVLKDSKV